MKLRVFEAFAGYGSQSIALRNIGVDYEVVAISEIDKYALQAYYALHDTNIPNLGDISELRVEDVPQHDLFTYSFPCQDISHAGKQKGIEKGHTRSGLLYECERIIEGCRPKYLLLENVKNLVGKKFKPQFDKWLEYLEGLGYTNYWQVLNAKDYGVPQNRERVFVVSILGEHKPYEFPAEIKLNHKLKNILENNVEDKYYLKAIKEYFIKNSFDMESKGNGFRFKPHIQKNAEIAYTLTTKCGSRMDDNFIIDLDLPYTNFEYSIKALQQIDEQSKQVSDAIEGRIAIRKLTPRECFRLMGMKDEDIDKIQSAGISNTQQYKMAGNSIVVNVLEEIFKKLLDINN